ncbi:hypothetical protein SLE2022_202000 [Rubroshorea leprosula]
MLRCRVRSLMRKALIHLVEDELKKYLKILSKKGATAWMSSPKSLFFEVMISVLCENRIFYLFEYAIPLFLGSLDDNFVICWALVHVVKDCFNIWVGGGE